MLVKNPTSDPKENIRREHEWIKHLKYMGEEPYEIEFDVNKFGKLLVEDFSNWLESKRIPLPSQLGELVVTGLTRFLLLREGRRVYSPLTCGEKLKADFRRVLRDELKATPAVDFMVKETLKLFTEYRKTLVPTVQ